MTAPLWVDVNQDGRNLDDPNRCRNDCANAHGEVYAVDSRHIAGGEHSLAHSRLLFSRQCHAAAGLSLLPLALLLARLLLLIAGLLLTLLLPILLLVATLLALLLPVLVSLGVAIFTGTLSNRRIALRAFVLTLLGLVALTLLGLTLLLALTLLGLVALTLLLLTLLLALTLPGLVLLSLVRLVALTLLGLVTLALLRLLALSLPCCLRAISLAPLALGALLVFTSGAGLLALFLLGSTGPTLTLRGAWSVLRTALLARRVLGGGDNKARQ
jgi:hypothetical protein